MRSIPLLPIRQNRGISDSGKRTNTHFPDAKQKIRQQLKKYFLWEISLCLSKSYLTIYRNHSQKLPVPKMPFMCDTHCLKLPKWGGYQQATVEAKNEAFSEIIHSSSLSTFRFMKFCPEWEKRFQNSSQKLPLLHTFMTLHKNTEQNSNIQSWRHPKVAVSAGDKMLSSPGSCHQSWWSSHPLPLTQALANNHPPNI